MNALPTPPSLTRTHTRAALCALNKQMWRTHSAATEIIKCTCKCVHRAMRVHTQHTHSTHNNKENAFKTGDRVTNSEAAEVDQLYLSLCARHKRLCVFAAERLGSYDCAFCFILVKVGRKTRGGRIKKNRQIKNAHIKQTDQNPPAVQSLTLCFGL